MQKYRLFLSHIGKNMAKLMFPDICFISHFQIFLYISINIHTHTYIHIKKHSPSFHQCLSQVTQTQQRQHCFSWLSFYTNPAQGMLLYFAYCKLHSDTCFSNRFFKQMQKIGNKNRVWIQWVYLGPVKQVKPVINILFEYHKTWLD